MFKIILILLNIFFLISNAAAITEIRFLDLNYIINNSKTGKEINLILQSKNNNNLDLLKTNEKIILAFRNDIITKKNILSQIEFDKKNNELKVQIETFDNLRKEKEKEIIDLRQYYLNILLKELNSIIVTYSNQNNIDIVIKKEDLITGKKDLDITQFILDKLNNTKIDLKWE